MSHASTDEQGRQVERFRSYLQVLARSLLDPRHDAKVDLSGVVQQTLWEAHRDWEKIRGLAEPQCTAWLRRALKNNLIDEVRRRGGPQRGPLANELSLETALDQSSCRLEAWLAADQSSPSQQAVRNEQVLQLAEALSMLPEDQRTAIELHDLQGLPLADIAEALKRSKGAIAQLLFRGHRKLASLLDRAVQGSDS
jgi:RNA polymerase sigma-70 factor (ECF subfamily)